MKGAERVRETQIPAVGSLIAWQGGQPCGPHLLNIRPTDSCNLSCRFCDKGLDRNDSSIKVSRELPDPRLVQVVGEAADLGSRLLVIDGGGEPFMRRDATLGMMREAKRRDMEGLLVTNGTLLRRQDVRKIVDLGWDALRVSVDGPNAASHDSLRGMPGSFDRAIGAVRETVTYRDERGKSKPEILLATVIMKVNYALLGDMLKLSRSLGARGVHFQPLDLRTRSAHSLLLSEAQMQEFQRNIPEIKRLSAELGITTNISHFKSGELIAEGARAGALTRRDALRCRIESPNQFLSAHCYAPWIYLGIRPDGTLAPCPDARTEDFDCLSLLDHSLEEAWFGPQFMEFRRRIMEHRPYAFCETCCGNMVMCTREYRQALKIPSCPNSSPRVRQV